MTEHYKAKSLVIEAFIRLLQTEQIDSLDKLITALCFKQNGFISNIQNPILQVR